MSEPNNTLETATPIVIPEENGELRIVSYTAQTVGGGDSFDYYSFVAPKDGWYYVETERVSGPNTTLFTKGSDGVESVLPAYDAEDIYGITEGNSVSIAMQAGETYYFYVSSGIFSTAATYNLRVIFPEGNETFEDATEINFNETRVDKIFDGDRADYFVLRAPESGQARILFSDVNGPNPVVRVYDSNQSPITIPYNAKFTDASTFFSVVAGDEYYIEVLGPNLNGSAVLGFSSASYKLTTLLIEEPLDLNESFSTASPLSPTGVLEDSLYQRDRLDYYKIEVEESGQLSVTLSDLADRPSTEKLFAFAQLSIYDSNQELIDSAFYVEGDVKTLTFDVVAGRHYFAVLSEAPKISILADSYADGTYTLTTELIANPADNNETFGAATAQSTVFEVTDVVGGPDPQDIYSITPTENGLVTFSLSDFESDADLLIYNEGGAAIAQSRTEGLGDEEITLAVEGNQTYYARILSKYNEPTPYSLNTSFTVTESPDGDIPATTEDALVIGLNSRVESDLNAPGDKDWFELTVPADGTYAIRVEAANSTNNSLSDPDLVLRRPDGSFVGQDAAIGEQAAEVILSDPGIYIAEVRSFSGDTGTYDLSVATPSGRIVPGDTTDIAGDTSSTATLALGTPIVSQIDSTGESDWFKVSVADDEELTVFVEGAASDKGTLTDPILVLRDNDGDFISQTDPSTGQNVQTTLESAGDYWIQVTASEGYTGSYTITASSDALPILAENSDFAADNSSNAVIVADQQAHASLDANGDKDWIKVTMETGQRFEVTVTGRGDDETQLNDPDVIIRTEAGGFVSQDFGNPGEPASVTIASAGTYWIEVRSFSGDSGDYAVTVADLFAEESSSASQQSYVSTTSSEDTQIVDTSSLS